MMALAVVRFVVSVLRIVPRSCTMSPNFRYSGTPPHRFAFETNPEARVRVVHDSTVLPPSTVVTTPAVLRRLSLFPSPESRYRRSPAAGFAGATAGTRWT